MMISQGTFFMFFEFWFFRLLGGEREKMVQNDKNFCPLLSIFLEPYMIWMLFMVYICKIIISPGVFSIFSKFCIFLVVGRG